MMSIRSTFLATPKTLLLMVGRHDREVPEVKYKVLAGADTKSTSKGKGKGKAVRK